MRQLVPTVAAIAALTVTSSILVTGASADEAASTDDADRLALLDVAVAEAVGDDLLPLADGGFCPSERVAILWEPVDGSAIHLGGYSHPLEVPDAITGSRATGIATCDGDPWAVAGFDADWVTSSGEGGSAGWSVFVQPVDLTREEVHDHEPGDVEPAAPSGTGSTKDLEQSALSAAAADSGATGSSEASVAQATAEAAVPVPAWPAGISHSPPPLSSSDPQDQCLSSVQPGTRALADLLVNTYPNNDDWSSLRGCNVGGRSEHKEGRALDWMVDATTSSGRAIGDRLTRWMMAKDPWGNSYGPVRHMGIMYMIWNRQSWYQFRADDGWRDYTGSSPHTDHVHFSLTWPGARCETTWWVATDCSGVSGTGTGNGNGNRVDRLAGSNRRTTALEVSRDAFDDAGTVVVASSNDYPDALAAGSLAAAVGGPLLLTAPDRLSSGVADEIRRLGANKIYVVGGQAAVSNYVRNQLTGLGSVERLAGADRVSTAAAIAREVEGITDSNRVLVVRMDKYADALSAINLAGQTGAPILLTAPDRLSDPARQAIVDLDPAKGWILGGTAALSSTVWSQVRSAVGGTVHRIAGANRYQTALAAVTAAQANGMDVAPAVLSSGTNYPDALSAGPAAVEHGGQLLLIEPNRVSRNRAVLDALELDADEISRAVITGGSAAVSTAIDPAVLASIGG